MSTYETRLKEYIKEHQITAEHSTYTESCHSVEEAAQAAETTPDHLIKSIAMKDDQNKTIIAIVSGTDRASTKRVAQALAIKRPHIAEPNDILIVTGYPCGGTPPFGYPAIFLIDENVMKKEYIYAGGGSISSLIKITPSELQKANHGQIARIRK